MKNPITVMLVDDSRSDVNLFREILYLIDESIIFTYALSGQAALDYFTTPDFTTPDFIFLDHNLPGMDGMECLQRLKKTKAIKHIPVIMYSGYDPRAYRDEAMKHGAVDCLAKPVHIEEACKSIAAIITLPK